MCFLGIILACRIRFEMSNFIVWNKSQNLLSKLLYDFGGFLDMIYGQA